MVRGVLSVRVIDVIKHVVCLVFRPVTKIGLNGKRIFMTSLRIKKADRLATTCEKVTRVHVEDVRPVICGLRARKSLNKRDDLVSFEGQSL